MKRLIPIFLTTILSIALLGCGDSSAQPSETEKGGYRQISQEEAQKLMESESGYMILDVRTKQEFDEGHIPKAICVPNETIDTTPPSVLPDKNQMILVYCRSGRRSKEAAQKLADMGYRHVIEFGGIKDWRGAITKE